MSGAHPSIPGVAIAHGPPGSSAVAAGSTGAVAAAVRILREGGNAVDAAVAAGVAATVAEPALTSLGGGGFCLYAAPGEAPQLLDFFVDVPGLGGTSGDPLVQTVVVDFARTGSAATASEQVFHGGWGTVAVPGCFAGYVEAHRRWGRLPIAAVVAPAARSARRGIALDPVQVVFLHLVEDLLALTPQSRDLFASAQSTGRFASPALADLLDAIVSGEIVGPHDEAYAEHLLAASHAGGGLLTREDLAAYSARARTPLAVTHREASVWTNPPPSFGGAIVVDALSRLDDLPPMDSPRAWAAVADALAAATLDRRAAGQVSTGTTHVSVVDAEGGVAALTTSNGSGSGTLVPGWGVTLNNMLGEEDLNPGGPGAIAPGTRMSSTMSPTLLDLPDGSRTVMGTGGSERIRSALLCVLLRLIDQGSDLGAAIAAPRLHLNPPGPVHVEGGLPDAQVRALGLIAEHRGWGGLEEWPSANLFFGGVHAARREADGSVTAVGDARRSGVAAVVLPSGDVVTEGP